MGLGNWGQELQNGAAAFFGSEYLRDFTHASKTFRTNSYANSPKLKFLFHTYFEINPDAWADATNANLGILVKDIKLPSYSFQTAQMNQYNRKRIIQTKIKYEPVTVTFHDDNANSVNKMWYAYYTYYYKDATKVNVTGFRGSATPPDGNADSPQSTPADYYISNIYADSIQGNDNWGYIGETGKPAGPNAQKAPFFKRVTIFGFNQHSYTAYTLVNPIITSFGHDTYNYDEGSGVMRNTMSIDYETVVYDQGAIDGNSPGDIVTGFGDEANYDRRQSPISIPGANATILGQGGLVDAAGGFMEKLGKGDILGAIGTAGRAYNTFKNVDLKNTLKEEFKAGLQNALNDAITQNRNVQFDFPQNASTPSNTNTAGSPTTGGQQNPATIGGDPTAGKQGTGGP